MIEIKDLLLRFSELIFKDENKKEAVRMAISKVIGVEIASENVEIKNNTIYLNIKPIYKNEIFLKKEVILAEISTMLGKKTPQDIR